MTSYAPPGWHTITPRILVDDPEPLVDFIKRVFDAIGDFHGDRPAELRIGDSIVMVSGDPGRATMNACLYVYVADVDATYRRSLDAGAIDMEAPADLPYGDRRAMVSDRWGNTWQIASRATPVPQ